MSVWRGIFDQARRFKRALGRGIWEIKAFQQRIAGRVATRRGWLARRLRFPLPGSEPFRRGELHLVRGAGLGDVLMCTPLLRELKRINPRCRVVFYTDFPSLIEGLSLVNEVRPRSDAPAGAIELQYEGSPKPRRHIARILGDLLGLDVRDVAPNCVVDEDLRADFRTRWSDLPRPWIIVNRHASAWTPNKAWPGESWEVLVDRISRWGTVIEVGTEPVPSRDGRPGSYLSLIGQLSLDGLIAAIAAADLQVGPISGPVHIAAAFGRPSVVIYGGYESPSCSNYPGNIDLGTDIACSPCWLKEPCPIDRQCLRQISPAAVEAALRKLWDTAPSNPRTAAAAGDARPAGRLEPITAAAFSRPEREGQAGS